MKFTALWSMAGKKLRRQRHQAWLLILPIALLVMGAVLVSSQTRNFSTAAAESISGQVAELYKQIQIRRDFGMQARGTGAGGFAVGDFQLSDQSYTQSDVSSIEDIAGVEEALLVSTLPISRAVTADIVDDVSISLSNFAPLASAMAAAYTDEAFSYTDGQPVPIILNAQSLVQEIQDWGGETSVTITMERGSGSIGSQASFPVRSEQLDIDSEELVGRTITISFGGLDELSNYEVKPSSTGMTFTKKTDAEMAELFVERQEAVSTYWDYDELDTPLTYTFVIVGVMQSETDFQSFIPSDFATVLMHDIVEHQLTARTEVEIPTEYLNDAFLGTTFDGVELASGGFNFSGRSMRIFAGSPEGIGGGLTQETDDDQTVLGNYIIPGLIIQTERGGDSTANPFAMNSDEVIGIYTDPDVYEGAVPSGDSILVRIDDVSHRTEVVTTLNEMGYVFDDTKDVSTLDDLSTNLDLVSWGVMIGFVALSIIIILFAVGKFVIEGKREIGIFRALGATERDIRNVFLVQSSYFVLAAYLGGMVAGLAGNFILAPVMKLWFQRVVGVALDESFGVTSEPAIHLFQSINLSMLGLYTVILLILTIAVSFIPAQRAARLSPVQAIKGE